MTPFQKQFISDCLDSLDRILSSEDQLNQAVRNFSGDSIHPRHQGNQYITNAHCWTSSDKIRLNAAVSEAIVRTTPHCKSEEELKALNEVTILFLTTIVPKITERSTPGKRLASVRERITEVQEELNKDNELETNNDVEYNPYNFFSVVLVAGAALAGTVLVLSATK